MNRQNKTGFSESSEYDPDKEVFSKDCEHDWCETLIGRKKIIVCLFCGEVKK